MALSELVEDLVTAGRHGVVRIAQERRRQIAEEFYSAEYDDHYKKCELLRAAICYAEAGWILAGGGSLREVRTSGRIATVWPWPRNLFKPAEDPARNLEKAGALLAAEMDRLERLYLVAAAPGECAQENEQG